MSHRGRRATRDRRLETTVQWLSEGKSSVMKGWELPAPKAIYRDGNRIDCSTRQTR
jgi:hypothetical protein